ncbi:MAG: hypothetical protein JSU74_01175 [Candidatus Zixiibacteriota bacterium]|nr:MAG: hypothetical protein JSU74_01175 [candidate division Zixibacteria bacterium]
MLKLFFITGVALFTLLLWAGCGGDDECPTCPSGVDTVTITETVTDTIELEIEYLAWTDAYIQLDPYFCINAFIHTNSGADPNPDSIRIGDSLYTEFSAYYFQHEGDPYYQLDECEDGFDPTYQSGDLATVTIWGSNRSSSATVVALDYWDDEALIADPDDGDTTVQYGNTVTCAWTEVDNAEWYGIEVEYGLDSAGQTAWRSDYAFTYDTVYTIPDTAFGYPVELARLYAVPVTGPDPESGLTNWEGDFTAGKLYSIGAYASATIWWENPLTAAKLVVSRQDEPAEKSAEDIVRAVCEAYR